MLPGLRRNIALRTTLAIIAVVSLVGIVVITLAGGVLAQREQAHLEQAVDDLLATVDNTLRLAVFLEDEILAAEVAQGLRINSLIDDATIYAGDRTLTGEAGIHDEGHNRVRLLYSPFDSSEAIGRIVVRPDREAMASQLLSQLRFLAVLFVMLLAATAASAALSVLLLVVQPISRISSRLHQLRIESGEQLPALRSHRHDELGRLVADINRILNRLVDMLGRERSERNAREREERRLRAIFDNVQSGIFQIDAEGKLDAWNPAFERLFNGKGSEEPVPASLSKMGDDASAGMQALLQRATDEQREVRTEVPIEVADGLRWLNVTLTPLGPGQYQGIANDITEQRQARQAAETLALTDPLTACLNRLGFTRALEELPDTENNEPPERSILMLDLDLFKAANDQYGHDAGDEVLRAVARRIQRQLKGSDAVARLGGDEFAMLLPGPVSDQRLGAIADNIIEAINRPVAVGANRIHVGASIGIASDRTGTLSGAALLKRADEAMYRAKHEGRNRYCVADA